MKTILYLTDFYYEAKGRAYYKEDLYITSKLKNNFNILIGHPHQVNSYLEYGDIIIFRNTGSVMNYEPYFKEFIDNVKKRNLLTFNSFDGKGDQKGKDYLLKLTKDNFPVIPTVENRDELHRLGTPGSYMVKMKNGADSTGQEKVNNKYIHTTELNGKIIQPFIDFKYEISFVYLNDRFQYALYAPEKNKRWELIEYFPSAREIAFADQFINWNNLKRGITRVDVCCLSDGSLLLVELEDLNPYLSLEILPKTKQDRFIKNWVEILDIM
ncbi:hypothetical protein SAMN06265171_105246 [Chryseobacterium rhizoplanae]|uniref:ATP-grasp domain-containing protein n=1 Tax=Chryseobacterium rhizoplanae TaxID=1609531 RepID=A0A521DLR7_9FLAO|nr:hypothetical protein [Chryseobacterium rhizoplanae]SMO72568.1 hypothetical protein SAMN06265171_105246 [Chryseobacterium rhizoplanae]